jgi:hypothetical protein
MRQFVHDWPDSDEELIVSDGTHSAIGVVGGLRANGNLTPAEGGVRSSTSSLPSIMA